MLLCEEVGRFPGTASSVTYTISQPAKRRVGAANLGVERKLPSACFRLVRRNTHVAAMAGLEKSAT